MNPLHGIVLALMCMVILFNVRLTHIKVLPASIILLFIVFYLFTQSPILGVVGIVAAYQLLPKQKSVHYDDLTQENQFQETLEEHVVNKLVPLSDGQSSQLNVKYLSNDHNACPL